MVGMSEPAYILGGSKLKSVSIHNNCKVSFLISEFPGLRHHKSSNIHNNHNKSKSYCVQIEIIILALIIAKLVSVHKID